MELVNLNWFYVIVFVLGIFYGSFLNFISDNIGNLKRILVGRSKCDSCQKTLRFLDLVPLFSYAISFGKCRYCSKKVSWYYPLSELVTGIFLVGIVSYIYLNNLDLIHFVYYLVNFSILLIIFFYDMKHFEIPFRLVVFGAVFSLIYRFTIFGDLNSNTIIYEAPVWLAIFLFFYLIIWLSKGGMGGGDLKLAVYLAIFLGFPTIIYSLYYSFILGGIFAFILLITRKKDMKAKIPFGPFLVIGSLIALHFVII